MLAASERENPNEQTIYLRRSVAGCPMFRGDIRRR